MTVSIVLPKPHLNQKKILDSPARYRIVLAGRRFGKSLASHIISIQHMLNGEHVCYITPAHETGKRFLKELKAYIPDELVTSYNQTERKIELITSGSITFFSGEAGERIRGTGRYSIAIIDEAAFIPNLETLLSEELLPVLLDCNGKLLMISTPNGQDTFHEYWLRGQNNEPDYESFWFTSYDNPKLPEGAVDKLKREITKAAFEQEIMAIPGQNTSSAFGDSGIINSNVISVLSSNPTVVFGIDISSGHGSDYTVITGLDAQGNMTYFDRGKWGYNVTKDKVKGLPSDINKVMDSTTGSAGEALFVDLQVSVPNLHPFDYTKKSKPEMIIKLIKAVETGKVKYNKTTATEMTVFQYRRNSKGYYSYNAKAGFNDDCVNSIGMAYYHLESFIAQSEWMPYSR